MTSSRLKVVSRGCQTSFDMALDAILTPFGKAMPLNVDDVQTPIFINQLLQQHGLNELGQAGHITDVAPLDIACPSSNCINRVIALSWQRKLAAQSHIELPNSLFIKLPAREVSTRLFMNLFGSWQLECDFYRQFSGDFPVRIPKVYAAANQRSRFILLQENLQADANVTLFTNIDMMTGPSLGRAKQCLTTFARIHSTYAHLSQTEREARLPIANHPFLSPIMRELGRVINTRAGKVCLNKYPDLFPADVASVHLLAMQHWDRLLAWWFREPLTLIHGDSHIGNFFVSGDELGMLDWQAAHWGKGIRDVQYFLINSLPSHILAEHEQMLLEHYIQALAENEIELSFDEAWEQYRAFSFHTLLTIVTSLALGALIEKDLVMKEVLQRAVAAVKRVHFDMWLDEFINTQA